MAELILQLIGPEASQIMAEAEQKNDTISAHDIDMWKHHLEQEVAGNPRLDDTERGALITALGRGQGVFSDRVMRIERRCRITQVENPVHLCASHFKPWRDSTDNERLNGENTSPKPSVDHLFDRGFISFEDSGELIVSQWLIKLRLSEWGLPRIVQ